MRGLLCGVVVLGLASCSAAGERRAFAESFDLPEGFEQVHRIEDRSEVGKIGGGVIDLITAEADGRAGSGDEAAARLCLDLAAGATIERRPHDVPADWDTCRFEADEERVLVGTYDRFQAVSEVRAQDACGPNTCTEDTLVIWIE